MSWLIVSMYSSSPVYSVKRGGSNRCESGQEVVRVEDGYFSQTEQTEGKGEGSGFEETHASWKQRSVSSRHRSRIDFLSLYLGTIDNRFWPRLLFVNFLLSSTVRISILGWVIYIYGFELFTRCTDGLWSREL